MTQKYKCIAQSPKNFLKFTIGKEYEVKADYRDLNPYKVVADDGFRFGFSSSEFSILFQKVEPTTQPMKYKVTITSTDLTGHEDVEKQENVTKGALLNLIDLNLNKPILIEPQPEKQKVTVWFYVVQKGGSLESVSSTHEDDIIRWHGYRFKEGSKLSDINSMEVEI
jgi:hypothetical protein